MKTKLLLMTMAAVAMVLAACSKDDDGNENIGTSVISGELVVEVSGIADDDNKRINSVKLVINPPSTGGGTSTEYVVDNVEYDQSKSKFILDLSEPVPDRYLKALGDDFDGEAFTDGITINNPSVKTRSAYLRAYSSGTSTYSIGAFFHVTGIGDDDWTGGLVYANGDATITGSGSDEDTWGDGYTEKINYKYSVSLKKGWNIIYNKTTETTKGKVSEYWDELTTQTPSGAVWMFLNGYDK